MITRIQLEAIENHGGMTLKKGQSITYKSGWQVATEGVTAHTVDEVLEAIKKYNGNCGLWLEDGIWYIDKSRRISTKKEAMKIAKAHKQISILKWSTMALAYC